MSASLRDDPRVGVASLATSEVVTNALMHGRHDDHEMIELRLRDVGDRVRVEVLNASATGFALGEVADGRADGHVDGPVGGWGLGIVDAVSEAWGVERSGPRTLVWFEV